MGGRSISREWLDTVLALPAGGHIDASAVAVAAALASHMDRDGLCWPSVRLLSDEAKCAPNTVQDRVRRLEEAGVLKVERKPRGANRYHAITTTVSPGDTDGRRHGAPETVSAGSESVSSGPESVSSGGLSVSYRAESVSRGDTEQGTPERGEPVNRPPSSGPPRGRPSERANENHASTSDEDEDDDWLFVETDDRVDTFFADLAEALLARSIDDISEGELVADPWLLPTYTKTLWDDGRTRQFVTPHRWSLAGQQHTAYGLKIVTDPTNLEWITRQLDKAIRAAGQERQRRADNDDDITASDAYQRGVAKAKAALSAATEDHR